MAQFSTVWTLTAAMLIVSGCKSEEPKLANKPVPVPGAIANEARHWRDDQKPMRPKSQQTPAKPDPPIATIPRKVTERDIGMPYYPGSQTDPSGKNGELRTGGHSQVVSERTTSDSPTKVSEYYHGKLLGSVVTGSNAVKMISGNLAGGAKFQIVAVKRERKTHIVISVAAN